MRHLTYLEPRSLPEAIALLDEHGAEAAVIAGGQGLLLQLKSRTRRPSFLVSVAAIPEMQRWQYNSKEELECGAAVTYSQLACAQLPHWHSEIASVASNLADDAVRNVATLGGAACQAEPRFDVPALLVGLNARLTVQSRHGARVLSADQFFNQGGGTTLAPTEILTTITFPSAQSFSKVAFEKYRVGVFDAALVSVVCAVCFDANQIVSDARITVGAVEKAPVLAPQSASALIGLPLPAATDGSLGEQIADEVVPQRTRAEPARAYQAQLIKALVRMAMSRLGTDRREVRH